MVKPGILQGGKSMAQVDDDEEPLHGTQIINASGP